jgi:hypothetical protein
MASVLGCGSDKDSCCVCSIESLWGGFVLSAAPPLLAELEKSGIDDLKEKLSFDSDGRVFNSFLEAIGDTDGVKSDFSDQES